MPFGAAGANLILGQALLQGHFSGALEVRANCGAHRRACGRQGPDSGKRSRFARDVVEEIVSRIPLLGWAVGNQLRQRNLGAVECCSARNAVFLHSTHHIGEPLLGAIGMAVGAVVRRPLGQARQHGAFLQSQGGGRFAEVITRRQLDPPRAAAEIDRVEIEFQDLGLAQGALQPRRHNDLAHLALIGDVVADQQVLHDLLGDGRTALGSAGAREVRHHGANEAALVDALMLVKALVLGCDERLLDVDRNILQRHPDPAVALGKIGEALAPGVDDPARTGDARPLEAVGIWQVGDGAIIEPDHFGDIHRSILDVFVLAEFSVDHDEAVEFQAVERLDLGRDCVRIIHRGLDEVVDIKGFDIECLAHMGAAITQYASHLGLVARRVELCFDGVRAGRDQAEREERR